MIVGLGCLSVQLLRQAYRVSTVPVPFDAAEWADERPVGMGVFLDEESVLTSMTVEEVEDLLGPADVQGVASGDGMMQYDLQALWYFDIVVEDGVVTSASVEEP